MHRRASMRFSEHSAGVCLMHDLASVAVISGVSLLDFRDGLHDQIRQTRRNARGELRRGVYQGDWEFRRSREIRGIDERRRRVPRSKYAESDWNGGMYCRNPFSSPASRIRTWSGATAISLSASPNDDSVGYSFTDICPFNVEYFRGDTVTRRSETTIDRWKLIPGVGVEEEDDQGALPEEYRLYEAYPNPFNPGDDRLRLKNRESGVLGSFHRAGRARRDVGRRDEAGGNVSGELPSARRLGRVYHPFASRARSRGARRHVGVTKAMYIK